MTEKQQVEKQTPEQIAIKERAQKITNHLQEVKEKRLTFINLLMSTKRDGIENLIQFLDRNEFFKSPASAKYHNSIHGGLCDHSLNVYNNYLTLQELKEEFKRPADSVILMCLLHDLCKINNYKIQTMWRKDDNNKWEKYNGYTYNDVVNLGHGAKSLIIAQAFIKLTDDEISAIFWHMGPENEAKNYYSAAAQNKAIYCLHFADLLSAQIDEANSIDEDLIFI